jgi:uncharacterized protein (DUF427 family)
MKAIWNDKIIAQSDNTVLMEGNHYFPVESVNPKYLKDSQTNTVCHWKGTASYYHVSVDGLDNPMAPGIIRTLPRLLNPSKII